MGAKSGVSEQVLSLPRGGGALKGVGEKFTADLHTGVGRFSIPLTVAPGRNGLQPSLQLSYATSGGNGPFGQGWSLPVPGVSRRTAKGTPRYDDAKDVFVLAGFEDLVPIRVDGDSTYYRPRVETAFARIRHVRDAQTNYWEVRTPDGLTSTYGQPGVLDHPSTLRDPRNATHVFTWRLTETRDPHGNRIVYDYERDAIRVDGAHDWDQSYLTSIRYLDVDRGAGTEFLAKVTFDYAVRPDPFSDYAAGFEIRTLRRARAVRVSTSIDEPRAVRRYELTYADELPDRQAELPANGVSLLAQVRVVGEDKKSAPPTQALPPIDLRYAPFDVTRRLRHALSGSLPPLDLGNASLDLADLEARGLPDFVEATAAGIRSWRNLGRGAFAPPKTMAAAPSADLADKGVQLFDSDGDGRIELVISGSRPDAGYYPLSPDARWLATSRRAQAAQPTFAFDDPEVRLIDLDRDGATDVLRTTPQHLEHYFHDEATGWTKVQVNRQANLDDFPNVSLSDPSVRLADLSGDGGQDIVLIQGRRVSYWANMGRGRWSRRIDMGELPQLPLNHDPARLHFADIDGDGAADAVYVEHGKLSLWINQGGNRWGTRIELTGLSGLGTGDTVRVVDLHGVGAAGILWSRVTTANRYEFLAVAGLPNELRPASSPAVTTTGTWAKPYVLTSIDNGRGARTGIEQLPSTVYRLRDDASPSRRWSTPLPFPVQVVAKVVTSEQFNRQTLTSRYTYHHGAWDGAEREFAGFGRVDHVDADEVVDATSSPPLETRTWFHQGAVTNSRDFGAAVDYSAAFWPGDTGGVVAEPGVLALVSSTTGSARRQILRALRGRVLREEVYGHDGSSLAGRPYGVTDYAYGVGRIVDGAAGVPTLTFAAPPPGIVPLFVFPSAKRVAEWERGDEPLQRYSYWLQHDGHGQPARTIDLGAPRAVGSPYLAKLDVVAYARRDDATAYITDRVAMRASFELPSTGGETVGAFVAAALAFDVTKASPLEATLMFYDGSAHVGLPLGQLGDRGALVRTEALAFTQDDLAATYGAIPSLIASGTRAPDHPTAFTPPTAGPSPRPGLTPRGLGYAEANGGTIPSGYYTATERRAYDFHTGASSVGLVATIRDALGNDATLGYDDRLHRPVSVTDAIGLTTQATYDPRLLEPDSTTDPNGTTTSYKYTPLGLLESVSVQSRDGTEGDDLQHPGVEYDYGLAAVTPAPSAQPHYVHTRKRVDHVRTTGGSNDCVEVREYSDGLGRLIQTRTLAEDDIWGDASFGDSGMDAAGQGPLQRSVLRPANGPPNVVVSGWTVLDGKGLARAKYEPAFAEDWSYEDRAAAPVAGSVRVDLTYDARGRVLKTTAPDGTFTQTVYGRPMAIDTPEAFSPNPWEVYTYDPNDNWQRADGGIALPAWTATHADTPASIEKDAWGRDTTATARLSDDPADDLVTESRFDLRGDLIEIVDPERRVAFRFGFDRGRRRLRTASLDGGAATVVLDAQGNEVERRDSKGALTVRSYDATHRPTRVWARDIAGEAVTLRERLVYGDQAVGRAAALAASTLGRVTHHHDEAGLLRIDRYDFRGRVIAKSRRVIDVTQLLTAFAGTTAPVAYRVDWQPGAGQTFDARAAQVLEPGAGHESTFRYDALGRVVERTYPRDQAGKRRTGSAGYNRAGALERVVFDGKPYVEKIGYTAHGRRSFVAYANGLLTRYRYDRRTFRLTRLRTQKATASNGAYQPKASILQNTGYEYDCTGNLTGLVERTSKCGVKGAASLRRTFDYDAIYRLGSATGRKSKMPGPMWTPEPRGADPAKTTAYTERYTYDAGGNVRGLKGAASKRTLDLATGVDASGIAATTNRLKAVTIGTGSTATKVAYKYDAAGNLTQENTTRRFAWDHLDRMRSFEDRAGNTATRFTHYLYDATGERVAKVTRKQGGSYVVTVYIDGLFEAHREVSGATTSAAHTVSHVVDGNGRLISLRSGAPRPGDTSPAIQHPLADHLGSVTVTADAGGIAFQREEFTPYGETSFGGGVGKRHRFTGMERDDDTGLAYHSARYYCPWCCRWCSCDALGVQGGVNSFTYARTSPMGSVDPSGQADEPPPSGRATCPEAGVVSAFELQSKRGTMLRLDERVQVYLGQTGTIAPEMDKTALTRSQSIGAIYPNTTRQLGDLDMLRQSFVGSVAFSSYYLKTGDTARAMAWARYAAVVGNVLGALVRGMGGAEGRAAFAQSQEIAARFPTEIPDYGGGKTYGVLVLPKGQGQFELYSGQGGGPPGIPLAGRNNRVFSHVEAHAAQIMNQRNASEGTLYINQKPCGSGGCEQMLKYMLPEGARLRVIGPEGHDQVYIGIPKVKN